MAFENYASNDYEGDKSTWPTSDQIARTALVGTDEEAGDQLRKDTEVVLEAVLTETSRLIPEAKSALGKRLQQTQFHIEYQNGPGHRAEHVDWPGPTEKYPKRGGDGPGEAIATLHLQGATVGFYFTLYTPPEYKEDTAMKVWVKLEVHSVRVCVHDTVRTIVRVRNVPVCVS